MRTVALVAIAVLSANTFAADALEKWTRDHWQAHRALLKVFDGHPNFRDKFAEESRDNTAVINDWILFLADRGDRNTNDFTEKRGREARGIKQLHENYGEHVRSFREWIRDHNDAAVALARINGGVVGALRTPVYEREREKPRKKKDRDD